MCGPCADHNTRNRGGSLVATRKRDDQDAIQKPAHPISALALVETVTAAQVFTENGLDSLIERIEKEARTTALDISTPKGRKEIASLAAKIAKSKTTLDRMGKELVSGWKEQAKKVDLERSRAWDRLEALQKEIRQPLTEWENADKDRIAAHEARLAQITQGAADITSQLADRSPGPDEQTASGIVGRQDRLAGVFGQGEAGH